MKILSNQFVSTFLLILLPASLILAQAPDTLWTTSIGESGSQIAYSVFLTGDGGYMLGGYTTAGNYDYYMVKTDDQGEVVWTKSFGEDDRYESSTSMANTVDGGYIMAGGRAQDSPYSSKTDIYLVKTDADGNQEWSSIIGAEDISETPNSIVQTNDGGYIVCGHYWASSQTVYDIWLVKTDSLGLEEWTQVINFEDGMADYAMGIELADDGGYLVTGETQAFSGDYSENAYILKTDMMGEMVWLKTYGDSWPWYESSYNIIHTSDGGFLICGNQDNDGVDKNWFVVKADGNGDEIWSDNTIGGTYHDGAFYACETNDGGYAVAGNYHEGTWNPFITKYSVDGDTLWTKMWTTGDDNSQYLYCIRQLDDGGYITVGSTTTNSGGHNIYLARLTPETVGIYNPERLISKDEIELLSNRPNPFSSITIIPYNIHFAKHINISIYDIYGQKVKELLNLFQSPGNYEVEFDGKNYTAGIYYCILSSGDKILTRKLIHQN